MSANLTFSDVDSEIQSRMRGSEPSSSLRLQEINTAMQDLYAEFDIDSSKREVSLNVIADGNSISLASLVDDFKHPSDLRYLDQSLQTQEFAFINDDTFVTHRGSNRNIDEYTTSYRDGALSMKVLTQKELIQTTVNGMTSLTDDGTWAVSATSDAVNLEANTVGALGQGSDLMFDVDVSNSVNNYAKIENSTLTAKDLSDYVNEGVFRFWIYIPSKTNFTSVQLIWGSSNAVYFSATATTQSDGSALIDGWNFISINWADATETGTVDTENIDYLGVQLNYAAAYTDQSNVKVEALELYLPVPMRLVYYTYYTASSTAGVLQENLTTTTTDELLVPKRFKTLVALGAMKYLIGMSFGDDGEIQLRRVEKEYEVEALKLGLDIGNRVKTPVRKVKIRKPW